MKSRKHKGLSSLILNADYTAMCLMPVRKALENEIKNSFDRNSGLIPVDYYDIKILSAGGRYFYFPSVLRNVDYIRPKANKIPFSRKNVFLRDNLTCMYCGKQDITGKTLTYDHVIPRAIWKNQNHKKTPTSWLNIVTCCKKCNNYKGNRTPEQAKMILKMKPFEPNPHSHIIGFSPWMRIHPTWEPYLPKNYKILLEKIKNGV